ncbi:MAG: imidazole glycerol phosphate synthase cyclase subunit [Candidatus Omnitrophica bacterium]|nr:imidazole glycerol phosphate synthase cyclase subunit [Candidatus Omnitrophota bacterium]
MLKKRLIPVLLLQNGMLVRSEAFSIHQIIGNPIIEVQRFNQWNVDELIYLDISRSDDYDLRREDGKVRGLKDPLVILEEVSKTCFMPLTWGGRIRTIDDMRQRFLRGADKITINTAAVETPELITQAAKIFGSQAVVVCIDAKRYEGGSPEVFIDGGRTATGMSPEGWAKKAEGFGAGEILLQSIDRDGMGNGYDLGMIRSVSEAVSIPVIALGGIGAYGQYADGIKAGASAAAAANIWHFKELSDMGGKRALSKSGVNIRM